jgi:type II secretory pathway component GspD/PulD (secretin)
LGLLFQKRTTNVEKRDLLIFITAKIAKESQLSPEEIAKLEERLERGTQKEKAVIKKKKR